VVIFLLIINRFRSDLEEDDGLPSVLSLATPSPRPCASAQRPCTAPTSAAPALASDASASERVPVSAPATTSGALGHSGQPFNPSTFDDLVVNGKPHADGTIDEWINFLLNLGPQYHSRALARGLEGYGAAELQYQAVTVTVRLLLLLSSFRLI